MGGVTERSMRDPPRTTIKLRVKTLDQRDLVGLLAVEEVPLVVWIWTYGERLALAVRVDQADWNQIRLGDAVRVGDGERVLEDLLDRPPYVDDLVARLQQPVRFLGQVVWYSRLRRAVALVDVHAVDGAAEVDGLGFCAALVRGCATDGVVEDEDTRCAGSG